MYNNSFLKFGVKSLDVLSGCIKNRLDVTNTDEFF